MSKPFVVVDAFVTADAFSGNPAGVLLLETFRDDAWLQGVADELHQAETAFAVPAGDGSFALRWFTPTAEVALCGHATLACAHYLWEAGRLAPNRPAQFDTRSGRLIARRHAEAIVLDFPAVPATTIKPPPSLEPALSGQTPLWTGITDAHDPGERNVLAVLPDEDAVRALVPDLRAVEQLPAGGLIVTAAGNDGDVVSRYFAPAYGIPEDPVTGSAHCTIGPYWSATRGAQLQARQLSARGGRLHITTTDSGRVLLQGQARTAIRGTIEPTPGHLTRPG